MIALGVRKNREERDLVEYLFHTRLSRKAARLFLAWFVSKGGSATGQEMSAFADRLADGSMGFKFGRRTFYEYIRKRFLDAGLIALDSKMDYGTRKVVTVYLRIIQPIQQRRPTGPSLIYNIHLLAEKWNGLFPE